MKEYNLKKKDTISQYLKKEGFFLYCLLLIFIFTVASMYSSKAIIILFSIMMFIVLIFDFEKVISLFLFCYPFEGVFYVSVSEKTVFIFPYFYAIAFGVFFVKYLINILRKKDKLNIKLAISFLFVLLYLLFPFTRNNIKSIAKYIVAFIFIYLIIENKSKINFNNVLIIACISLTLSILISPLLSSSRLSKYICSYYSFGYKKNQALFENPNWLAIYSILLISIVSHKFINENRFWISALIIILPYSYLTLSRDYIICLSILLFYLFFNSVFIKKTATKILRCVFLIFLIFIVALIQLDYTKIYLRRIFPKYNDYVISSQIKNQETSDSIKEENKDNTYTEDENNKNLWIDGTPVDPGRLVLWKRYINDYKSLKTNILFGKGISAEVLGIEPHNSYINMIWQFGIIGTLIILIFVIYPLLKNLLEKKVGFTYISLFLVLFINFFESNIFNYVAIMMIIILFCTMPDTNNKNLINKI